MSDPHEVPVKNLRSTVLIFALLIILAIAVGWNHLPFDKGAFFFRADDPVTNEQEDDTVEFSNTPEFQDDGFMDEPSREKDSLSNTHRSESGPMRSTSYQTETPFQVEGVRNPETSQQHVQTAFSAEVPKEKISSQKTVPPVTQEYQRYLAFLEKNLGATESQLEYWGSDGNLVRFTCYVPGPKMNSGAKKHFQAIAATPLDAIGKTVRDVQAWHHQNEK